MEQSRALRAVVWGRADEADTVWVVRKTRFSFWEHLARQSLMVMVESAFWAADNSVF